MIQFEKDIREQRGTDRKADLRRRELKTQMNRSSAYLVFLLLSMGAHPWIQLGFSVGRAQVVVSSIYWGSSLGAPISAHPGDVNVPLSVVLTNVGDDVARGVMARLELKPPFSFDFYQEGKRQSATVVSVNAGDIAAGFSYVLRFILSIDWQAGEGIYRLLLHVSYSSARELGQVTVTQDVDLPVWRGRLHVQRVVTTPEKIYPGSIGVLLRIWIVNTGQGAEQDVEVKLALEKPFKSSSSSSDRVFLGLVAPNQPTLAEVRIDVDEDAKAGDYSIPLLSTIGKAAPAPLGSVLLYVNEKARFEVVGISPQEVRVGDTGVTVSIQVRNVGRATAKSVRIQVRPGNFFSGTLTDFLGTLEPGELKNAFVTVDVDGKAQATEYRIDLRVDWTQDENSLHDTIIVVLKVAEKPILLQLLPMLIPIVLVLFALGYYRRRRMKTLASGI